MWGPLLLFFLDTYARQLVTTSTTAKPFAAIFFLTASNYSSGSSHALRGSPFNRTDFCTKPHSLSNSRKEVDVLGFKFP